MAAESAGPPPRAASPVRDVAALFALSLLLRLGWVSAVWGARSHDLASLFPDSARYCAAAGVRLNDAPVRDVLGLPFDTPLLPSDPLYRNVRGMSFYSGMGYPAFLKFGCVLFGERLLAVLIVQAVLSAAACSGIAVLAWQWSAARGVLWAAGLAAALSPTSIALSAAVLTETVFQACWVWALVFGVRTIRSAGIADACMTSVLFVVSVAVKAVVQFVPVIVLGWSVAQARRGDERDGAGWRRMAFACVMCIGGIVGIARAHQRDFGALTVSPIGVHSLRYMLGARALAQATGEDMAAIQRRWARQDAAEFGEAPQTYAGPLRRDWRVFFEVLTAHPAATVRAYAAAVIGNCIAGEDLHALMTPQWAGVWRWIDPLIRCGLGPGVPLAAVAAGVWAWRRGQWRVVAALAALYAYFALASGVAFWQGSRYLFPAQPAWCLLVGWAAARGFRCGR